LAAHVRHARLEAVRRGLKTQLEFSKDRTSYRLKIQDPQTQYATSFVASGDSFTGDWRPLPEWTKIKNVIGEDGTGVPTAILFQPDGRCKATELVLQDRDDTVISVYLGASAREVGLKAPAPATAPTGEPTS
jgi:hypothetical protein